MPTAATIGSALIGAYASNRASAAAAKQQKRAIAAQNELIGPFQQAGVAGLEGVQQFVDQGADFSQTQAFKDIINTQKARGASLSGGTLTSLTDFYAKNFRPQRLNELLALPTIGANAAARQATNVGDLRQSLGATQAGGALGVGSAAQQGIGSLAFLNLTNPTTQGQVTNLLNQPGMF